jgi:N,N'-diacetyllegionaminate synthase
MNIKIHNKIIGEDAPVFIIAEAGVNHNGDMKLAKKLIDAAVATGADAVKFQSFDTGTLIRKDAPKAKYQDRNIGETKSQYEMLKELEVSEDDMVMLQAYSADKGIIFLSTAYDFPSLDLLEKINVSVHKLASIDIVFHPMIKKIAETGKPLILSAGMATKEEIEAAVEVFKSVAGNTDNLILLQCNTNYPSLMEEQNLNVITWLKTLVPTVGFSDHTVDNTASIVATTLGARVIERHFTLDNDMTGPDHKASLNPANFTEFVKVIRQTEAALGSQDKQPTPGELENITGMRRSICAKTHIVQGTIITQEHLAYKRPGDGLYPTQENIDQLIGKKATEDIPADSNILLKMLK